MSFEKSYRISGTSKVFQNMGGPMTRSRSEKIESCFLGKSGLKRSHEVHFISIPPNVNNLEEWLLNLARSLNWRNWDEAIPYLDLPAKRHLIFPLKNEIVPDNSKKSLLRSAVILAKCNDCNYLPDSPLIFSRTRLERKLELMTINLTAYYELD